MRSGSRYHARADVGHAQIPTARRSSSRPTHSPIPQSSRSVRFHFATVQCDSDDRLVSLIVANGVSADKVLIGKPATAANAENGQGPEALAVCVEQARDQRWNGG